MSRRSCAHCQRLWSAQTLVTVGAAELCPVCYRLGRVTAPCWRCTPETGRTVTCHDSCIRYAVYAKLIAVARVSEGERIANDINNISQCRSVRRRRTSKLTQR